MKTYNHFIDGKWAEPATCLWLESENPYTRQTWARIARGNTADVDAAVEAALQAFETGPWTRMTASARGKLLWRMGD